MWDNHEFSQRRVAVLSEVQRVVTTANQTRKVAANQAFFEYQPARLSPSRPASGSIGSIGHTHVTDMHRSRASTLKDWGPRPNNLAALASLQGYRVVCGGEPTSSC